MQHCERLFIAKWAGPRLLHDLLYAHFTVVVSTAADQVGLAEDLQADGTLALEQGGRRIDELTRITTLLLGLGFQGVE